MYAEVKLSMHSRSLSNALCALQQTSEAHAQYLLVGWISRCFTFTRTLQLTSAVRQCVPLHASKASSADCVWQPTLHLAFHICCLSKSHEGAIVSVYSKV